MTAIFSRTGLLGLLLLLAGCGEREPAVITPPTEVAAVIEPFLAAIRNGQIDAAKSHVLHGAADELDTQFAADYAQLAKAPPLKPRFLEKKPTPVFGANFEIVTLVYAARHNGKWTSATIRAARSNPSDPFKVEYWRVTNAAPQPTMLANADPKRVEMQQKITIWMMAGLSLLGVLGLILIFWLVKRKPHLIAPDAPAEVRKSAATVRDA
jgi:hypothetical protein